MNKEYIGKKINSWTILSYSGQNKFGQATCLCQCDCGKKEIKSVYEVLHNGSRCCRSCSARKRKTIYSDIRNDQRYKRLKNIFWIMKQRCYNKKNPKYSIYGGKGISICEEWLNHKNGFLNFFHWAVGNGYTSNLTIDRIDYTRSYSPDNCRWTTQLAQQNNKSTNRWIVFNGERLTLMQFSQKHNIPYKTLLQRIHKFGITDPKELAKKKLVIRRKLKYFATIEGKTLPITKWCEKLNLNKESVRNRIKKYGYTPEDAILKPIKKTNRIY